MGYWDLKTWQRAAKSSPRRKGEDAVIRFLAMALAPQQMHGTQTTLRPTSTLHKISRILMVGHLKMNLKSPLKQQPPPPCCCQ